jgi:hypothetical protein
LPIYKKFSDHAHTHRFRESLSQHWGENVPNSLRIDIEQAHRIDAELRYLAAHQAQNGASAGLERFENTTARLVKLAFHQLERP